MKIKKRIYPLILSICVFTLFFSNISVKATTPTNTFSTSTVIIDGNTYNCYVYSDETLLPSTFQFYWVDENNQVCHALISDALTVTLTKKLGLSIKPSFLTTIINFLTTPLAGASAVVNELFSGGITRVVKGSTVVGIALNDLTGKPLKGDNLYTQFTLPSTINNYVFNQFNVYLEDNPELPDKIEIHCSPTIDLNPDQTYFSNYNSYFGSFDYSNNLCLCGCLYYSGATYSKCVYRTYGTSQQNNNAAIITSIKDKFAVVQNTNWTSLCNAFAVNNNNPNIYYTSIKNGTSYGTYAKFYTIEDFTLNNNADLLSFSDLSTQTGNFGSYQIIGSEAYPIYNGSFTLYKESTIPYQIKNNTYSPNYYISNNYKNYNTTNDNSVNITIQNINNATSDSSNVYNQTQTTTNEEITNNNYSYETNNIDNSVTTIINNYYYGSDPDPDPDPDPDDDDSIWEALLKAIGGFFEKIGELLATLLTGIFSIFTSILDAITSITEDFTSITSFISSFFSWLPAQITSLIVLGLGLALICAFLTWFKK